MRLRTRQKENGQGRRRRTEKMKRKKKKGMCHKPRFLQLVSCNYSHFSLFVFCKWLCFLLYSIITNGTPYE